MKKGETKVKKVIVLPKAQPKIDSFFTRTSKLQLKPKIETKDVNQKNVISTSNSNSDDKKVSPIKKSVDVSSVNDDDTDFQIEPKNRKIKSETKPKLENKYKNKNLLEKIDRCIDRSKDTIDFRGKPLTNISNINKASIKNIMETLKPDPVKESSPTNDICDLVEIEKLEKSKRKRDLDDLYTSSPEMVPPTPPLKKTNKYLCTSVNKSETLRIFSDTCIEKSIKPNKVCNTSFSPPHTKQKNTKSASLNRSMSEGNISPTKIINLSDLSASQFETIYKDIQDKLVVHKDKPNTKNFHVSSRGNKDSKNVDLDIIDDLNDTTVKGDLKTSNTKMNSIEDNSPMKHENDFDNTLMRDAFDDEWNYNSQEENIKNETLDLTSWQTCEVIDHKNDFENNCIVLKVKSVKNDEIATCLLKGAWNRSRLDKSDVVNIKASRIGTQFVIDNKFGMLVTRPDILISSTSVVGSVFCRRKAVFDNVYSGIGGGNSVMVIGAIVHEALQIILQKKMYTEGEIKKLFVEILKKSGTLSSMYDSSMKTIETLKILLEFVPRIMDFIEHYILGKKKKKANTKNWTGSIDKIKDIEENVWCPRLGIKGRIDVTVESNGVLMPLELKTGRASMSVEHRGQLMLYLMMMAQQGQKVDSGLLLYIKEGIMCEINSDRNEQSALIMLRNELAYYLSRKPEIIEKTNDENDDDDDDTGSKKDVQIHNVKMPDPICHHSACGKCPYLTICSIFLSQDENITLNKNNPLYLLSKDSLSHLTKEHIDYFVRWGNLILIENSDFKQIKHYNHIWSVSPAERENKGKSIVYVRVKGSVIEINGKFSTVFTRSANSPIDTADISNSGISISNYVVISTDERPALAAGNVTDITKYTVTVSLERDLTRRYPNQVFHIDTYDSNTLITYNMSNIAYLMENTEICERLRKIIIDKSPPVFLNKMPKKVKDIGMKVLRNLNQMQQRAVLKTISSTDYALIKGMPGTGKTQTVAALIQMFVGLGQSVLVTSHTNSAVDNVLIRLQENSASNSCEFLRLGHEDRVHHLIRHRSESVLAAKYKTVEELELFYDKMEIVGVTCLGANHPLLSRRKFDVCIVDESTQVLQSSILRPLFSATKFVLIGDPDQLSTVIKNQMAIRLGMDESLFDRLHSPTATINLTLQYRMNKMIMTLANDLTYNGLLLSGSDTVRDATLRMPNLDKLKIKYKTKQWLLKTCSSDMENSVLLLDTDNTFSMSETFYTSQMKEQSDDYDEKSSENLHCTNICEAAIIYLLIKAFVEAGVSPKEIGIIAPYRAQVSLLKNLVGEGSMFAKKISDMIEVNTVDQYQGRDKQVIIYSCTRSFKNKLITGLSEFSIHENKRRLTVAVTRAKHKLIMIGDRDSLEKYKPFRELFSHLTIKQVIPLKNENMGFEWDTVLNIIKPLMKKLDS